MKFVLTRDMCPIHYSTDQESRSYAHFICPLPLGHQKIVAENRDLLHKRMTKIVQSVNIKALKREPPFQNILVEYRNREEKDQLSLLNGFQIQDVGFDVRGLYSVAIHGSYGDIYLDTNTHHNCDHIIFPFKEFFEPNTAFCCHNVDYYWQALLTREVVVEYFNVLSSLAVNPVVRGKLGRSHKK